MLRRDVQRLLEALRPRDARVAAFRLQMQRLLERDDPFSRHHLDPGHFTASALVLDPTRTQVALIEHPSLGCWLQPGGHFEPSDAGVSAAARREVLEETGLEDLEDLGLHDIDIHDIPANPRKGEGPHKHFDLRWLFAARTRNLVVGGGVLGARWVPVDAIDGAPTDESVRRSVRMLAEARR